MRELKIRAWYKHDNPKLKFIMKEIDCELMFVMEKDEAFCYPLSVVLLDDDWIKEIWTGLPDIYGVDIYEGDIVLRQNDNKKYAVIEDKAKYWICNNNYQFPLTNKCVVIGDIHKKPELLEEE